MNLSLYTITQWVPTIFVNQGIDIKSSLVMSMTMMVGAPIGVFISTLIMDKLALPDERLAVLSGFAHLKSITLALRPKGYPAETQAKIKALLPKVEVKFVQ